MSLNSVPTLPPISQEAEAPRLSAVPSSQGLSGDTPNVAGAGSSRAVTQISQSSQLMSKLGQLGHEDPTKFKAVTKAIAEQLGGWSSTTREELAKRSALEAEIARVAASASGAQTSGVSANPTVAPSDATASARSSLAEAFTRASSDGGFGSSARTTAVSWTESGLAGALSQALTLVDQALGLTA
jgi:hypothetical protein